MEQQAKSVEQYKQEMLAQARRGVQPAAPAAQPAPVKVITPAPPPEKVTPAEHVERLLEKAEPVVEAAEPFAEIALRSGLASAGAAVVAKGLELGAEALEGHIERKREERREGHASPPAPPVPPAPVQPAPAPTIDINFAPQIVQTAPVVTAPTVTAPVVEAPVVVAPAVEAPTVVAPAVETPVAVAPTVEAPTIVAPAVEAPTVVAPAVEAPVVAVQPAPMPPPAVPIPPPALPALPPPPMPLPVPVPLPPVTVPVQPRPPVAPPPPVTMLIPPVPMPVPVPIQKPPPAPSFKRPCAHECETVTCTCTAPRRKPASCKQPSRPCCPVHNPCRQSCCTQRKPAPAPCACKTPRSAPVPQARNASWFMQPAAEAAYAAYTDDDAMTAYAAPEAIPAASLSDVAFAGQAPAPQQLDGYYELPAQDYASLEDFLARNTARGILELQVRVASDEAAPVPGAVVDILKTINGVTYLFHHGVTDAGGSAGRIVLPAPDRNLSFAPPHGFVPYATYTVSVTHGDYAPQVFENVTVFPDTQAVQVVRMGQAPMPSMIDEGLYVM